MCKPILYFNSQFYCVLIIILFFYFRYVFLEGAHQSGQLSSPEYALMKQWFNFSVDNFRKQIIPDLIGIFDLNTYFRIWLDMGL